MLINSIYGTGGIDMCITGFNNFDATFIFAEVISSELTQIFNDDTTEEES